MSPKIAPKTAPQSVGAAPMHVERIIGNQHHPINGVSCTKDGRVLVASMAPMRASVYQDQVSLWSTTGQRLGGFGTGTGCVCWNAEMSPDGRTVAAGFGDCTLRLWDSVTKESKDLAKLGGIVASLAWSADGSVLFTGNCGDKTVRLWETASGTLVAQGKTAKSGAWMVALSPDGNTGLSGSSDKVVHIWDTRKGREIGGLVGHTGKILSLGFSSDGRRAVSASQDKTIHVWDMKTGQSVAQLIGHKKQVFCARFFADGRHVASTSGDGTIKIWDTSTQTEVDSILLLPTKAESIAIANDDSEIYAGCDDSLCRAFTM